MRRQVRAQAHADLCSLASENGSDNSNKSDDEFEEDPILTTSVISEVPITEKNSVEALGNCSVVVGISDNTGTDNVCNNDASPADTDFVDCQWIDSDTNSEDRLR